MLSKDLNRTVQRQRFDRVTSSGRGCGLEKRVVDGFFGSFDNREENWRHCIVCNCFLIARRISFGFTEGLEPYVSGGRECDGITPLPLLAAAPVRARPIIALAAMRSRLRASTGASVAITMITEPSGVEGRVESSSFK